MSTRRLGVMGWLLCWAAISAIQVAPLLELIFVAWPVPLKLGWLGAWQLVKIVPTVWRLNDLGRAPDDAVVMVLPVFNIAAFFGVMLSPTPAPAVREKRRSVWFGRLSAAAALVAGARLAIATAPLAVPLTLIYAVISAAGGEFMFGRVGWARSLDAADLRLYTQVLFGLSGFLLLYTALQFLKRETASRASWVPSLFTLPAALVGGAFWFIGNGMGGELGPLVLTFLQLAWQLAWSSVGGAALAIAHVLLAEAHRQGNVIDGNDLFAAIRSRTLDVAGPHGARVTAVVVGMQVLVPGIFYATQLAFTDMVAVLEPDQPALKRSARLTWGMRFRIFKLLAFWAVLTAPIVVGLVVLIEGPELAAAAIFDPSAVGFGTYLVEELVVHLSGWVCELAFLVLYWERLEVARRRADEAQAEARDAERLAGEPAPT